MLWLLPKSRGFRGFTALLLPSHPVQGTAATLGPVGGAATGEKHLEVPVVCSFAFSPLEGHPEGLLGADSPPSLRVLHPKAAAVSVRGEVALPGLLRPFLQPGWSHRQG